MVSVRATSPEQMIGYTIPGDTGVRDQYKQPNWDQSLFQLAQGLQHICRSPDGKEKDRFLGSKIVENVVSSQSVVQTVEPQNRTPPTYSTNADSLSECLAPSTISSPLLSDGSATKNISGPLSVSTDYDVLNSQRMPVRHQQSESKLDQKLKEICHSPRQKILPHDHEGNTACGQRICNAHRRPSFLHRPQFLARADVGICKAEDLILSMDGGMLKVSVKRSTEVRLVCEVQIPPDVDIQHLVCILRDNTLEVSQTGKRKPVCERNSYSMLSAEGVGFLPNFPVDSSPAPIVIEDKVYTDIVRLVLTVPSGYKMDQIAIQTVDDHLIIKGHPHRKRKLADCIRNMGESTEFIHHRCSLGDPGDVLGFTRVFELPSSWDPFSIVAQLNEKHQLIIDVKLTYRCRCQTLQWRVSNASDYL